MPINYCTLFDHNFLTRGLTLYDSLVAHSPDFILWIMCNNDQTYETLSKLSLPNIRLLKMSEVEDARMVAVKPTRNVAEYCWMFSSALPLYILEHNTNIDSITYLDADLYFYASPKPIFDEAASSSIMIIPHGYSKKNAEKEKTSGKYNVGMMTFKNDAAALECLRWWKDRCIEWCFDTYEDGKLGDQMYLDDWTTRFKNVHVLSNLGANIASWNIDRFKFRQQGQSIIGTEIETGLDFELIFYHFHALKLYSNKYGKIKAHPITIYNKLIYKKYLLGIQKSFDRVRAIVPDWNYGTKKLDILRIIKQYVTITLRGI